MKTDKYLINKFDSKTVDNSKRASVNEPSRKQLFVMKLPSFNDLQAN